MKQTTDCNIPNICSQVYIFSDHWISTKQVINSQTSLKLPSCLMNDYRIIVSIVSYCKSNHVLPHFVEIMPQNKHKDTSKMFTQPDCTY